MNAVDLFVLALYMIGVVWLGLWLGRGVNTLSAYWLGDRQIPCWAILGSIVATETSTATFLSVPGRSFQMNGDLTFLQLAFGYLVGRVIIVWFLLPLYFRRQIFTAYEVLEQRFGGATKTTASIVFLVTRNLGDGLRLFLAAIALKLVVGIPLPFCIVVIGVATVIYTFFGGMRAVVWNDCLQFIVYMTGGLIAGVVIIYRLPGGFEQFIEFGHANGKFRVFDFAGSLWSPAINFWAGMVGGVFLTLGTHGTDQMMVQRYLCASSEKEAGWALVMSGFVVLVQFAVFLLIGVGLACFYHQYPPANAFETDDYVFATFIVTELPAGTGLIGVVLAAVFAAAMSTLSSSLNSSTSSAVNDLLVPLWNWLGADAPRPRTLLMLSRVLTVVFGVIQVSIGIAAARVSKSVVIDALAIAGFSAGLLLGVFSLGVLTPFVRQRSALLGFLAGLVVLVFLRYGLPLLNPSWTLAWPWYPVAGALTTFGFGVMFSYLIGERRGWVDS